MDSLILADCGSDEYTKKLEEQVLELSKLLQQLHAADADADNDNGECDVELAVVPTSKRKRHSQLKRLRRILPGVGKKEATQLPADDNAGETSDNEEVSPEYIDACECRLNALQDELRKRREIEFGGIVATGLGTVRTLENDQGSSTDDESSMGDCDDDDSIIAMAKRLDNTKRATIDDPSHIEGDISVDVDKHHRKKTKDSMHHHKSKKVGSSSTDQPPKKTKKKQSETTKRHDNLDKNKNKPIPRKSRVQKMQGSGHAIRLSSQKAKVVNGSTKKMGSSRKQSDEKDRKKIDRKKKCNNDEVRKDFYTKYDSLDHKFGRKKK